MSLAPGFLDELRSRTSLMQVVGRKVMWDQRKSNQGKGDMWAPCPFHQEKTASFHVDDRQGFYYCFGCHAKGDAISFVRETENVGFMEAIEILAREAGMTLPARDPQAQQKADRRTELADAMEQAVQFYRLQLRTAAAGEARDYLSRRGLSESALARFDIGYAPDARQALWSHLTGKGLAPDVIVDAGLAARPDGGGTPYDRFRGRIIFPIRNPHGRCIGLGGRAMAADARAKYLNSPETELFDKGRSLYNHGPAREAAGKGKTLVVAEGYMDVIALVEAGFEATVAPLGTAITEDQLQLMWRIHPEPIIALDGDKAGLRAAMRVIDIALPLLKAGQSLRFAIMPEGQDPDDLIRAQGAAAMEKLLDQALPMVRLLWQRETEGKVFDSPERKAALDKSLRDALKTIADPSIRNHYAEDIKQLRWQLFRPATPPAGRGRKPFRGAGAAPAQPMPSTRSSYLGALAADGAEDYLREAAVIATIIANPAVLRQFEGALESLDLRNRDLQAMRASILRHAESGDLAASLAEEFGTPALEKLMSLSHLQIIPAIRQPGNMDVATMCVAQELAKLAARRGVERETSDAMQEMDDGADEGTTWRLTQAVKAWNEAERSQTEDKTEYETGENGARINREERSALQDLLEKIDFAKRPGRSN